MYILRINPRAFVRHESNGDTTIVTSPEKASTYNNREDAMQAAVDMNALLETDKVTVFSLQWKMFSFE